MKDEGLKMLSNPKLEFPPIITKAVLVGMSGSYPDPNIVVRDFIQVGFRFKKG